MRTPDFFIVGAPKFGTSALYTYLKAHPEIFMAPIKEPHYFYTVSPRFRQTSLAQRYLSSSLEPRTASSAVRPRPCYLFSDAALQTVIAANPRAKIIAMVRNPINMVISFHRQKLYTFQEDVADFEAAWRPSEERAKGLRIPRACTAPEQLLYPHVSRMGDHVDRLVDEDRALSASLCHHLRRPDSRSGHHVPGYSPVPGRSTARLGSLPDRQCEGSPIVGRGCRGSSCARLMRPPFPFDHLKAAAKLYLGPKTKTLAGIVYPALSVGVDRLQLSGAFLAALSRHFRDDVGKLSNLLGRDLRHWCDGYAL